MKIVNIFIKKNHDDIYVINKTNVPTLTVNDRFK